MVSGGPTSAEAHRNTHGIILHASLQRDRQPVSSAAAQMAPLADYEAAAQLYHVRQDNMDKYTEIRDYTINAKIEKWLCDK